MLWEVLVDHRGKVVVEADNDLEAQRKASQAAEEDVSWFGNPYEPISCRKLED